MPASVNHSNAKHYKKSAALTEVYDFPGRSHWTCAEPGWEQVADKALEWAVEHARGGAAHDDRRRRELRPASRAAIVPPSSYAASVCALGHVAHHLEHVVPLLPAERPGDRQHRPDRPGGVVAAVHVEPERPPRGRALADSCRTAVVGQRAADLEEGRVEDVLHARRSCSRSSPSCRARSRRPPAGPRGRPRRGRRRGPPRTWTSTPSIASSWAPATTASVSVGERPAWGSDGRRGVGACADDAKSWNFESGDKCVPRWRESTSLTGHLGHVRQTTTHNGACSRHTGPSWT